MAPDPRAGWRACQRLRRRARRRWPTARDRVQIQVGNAKSRKERLVRLTPLRSDVPEAGETVQILRRAPASPLQTTGQLEWSNAVVGLQWMTVSSSARNRSHG